MDLKVYEKEEVLQPDGTEYVYVPDVIDIYPEYKTVKNAQTCTLTELRVDAQQYLYVLDLDVSKNNDCVILNHETGSAVSVVSGHYDYTTDTLEVPSIDVTITNVSDNINTVFTFTTNLSDITLSITADRSVINFDNTKSGTYYVLSPDGAKLITEQLNYNALTDTLTLADNSVITDFSATVTDTVLLKSVELSETTYLDNAITLDKDDDIIEQECALATIWQKGNDPIDTDDGISWSECLLGEINVIQIMQQLVEAVQKITLTVKVSFDAVTDKDGQTFLSYTLKAVG